MSVHDLIDYIRNSFKLLISIDNSPGRGSTTNEKSRVLYGRKPLNVDHLFHRNLYESVRSLSVSTE